MTKLLSPGSAQMSLPGFGRCRIALVFVRIFSFECFDEFLENIY